MMTPRGQGDLYERSLAERLGGKTVVGSGSTEEAKEDVILKRWLLQVKSTTQGSHTFKKVDLRRLRAHADNTGRLPLYVVGFFTFPQQELRNTKLDDCEEWVAMPLSVFRALHLEEGLDVS
jgi:hypothetical protein